MCDVCNHCILFQYNHVLKNELYLYNKIKDLFLYNIKVTRDMRSRIYCNCIVFGECGA